MTAPDNKPVLTIAHGRLSDFASALYATGTKLTAATQSALDLLRMTGNAGAHGDTADDLKIALACHLHLLSEFNVRVRTEERTTQFNTQSPTSFAAYAAAADAQGDTLCAITVTPVGKAGQVEPTRAALAAAHRDLKVVGALDDALKDSALSVILRNAVRRQSGRRPPTDLKRLAANDYD